MASLARFWASGALPRLRWSIFGLWERSRGFAGAFLGFGSAPAASLARFRASGALPLLHLECFFAHRMGGSFCVRYHLQGIDTRALICYITYYSSRE